MATFKRGKTYWYHFVFNGLHVQKSTKQGNPRVARQIEAACRTALAKGEVGIVLRKSVPTLRDYQQRFMDAVHTTKPATIEYYAEKLRRLLEYDPMAKARLDQIDEALIESYVQKRKREVSLASVNRELAVLRRGLRLAQEWRLIDRVPRIRMLPGEKPRNFVLSRQQEQLYLEIARQPLNDVAILCLDTGLRIGEALALTWDDIHLYPRDGNGLGYIDVRTGKSKNAQRRLFLNERVHEMLRQRSEQQKSGYVFPGRFKIKPIAVETIDDHHAEVRTLLRMPKEFVIHSLRHTFGTRLAEAGVDVFTIKKLMGHSSVTVSERYVHPGNESVMRAFALLAEYGKRQQAATISATVL